MVGMEKKFSIAEMAHCSGVTRRGVRFYVQKGLLPPPAGAGRGHYYTQQHLDRLIRIKELQAEGFSLEQILAVLNDRVPIEEAANRRTAVPSPKLWVRVDLAPGLELNIQTGLYKVTPGRVRQWTDAILSALKGKLLPNSDEGENQ